MSNISQTFNTKPETANQLDSNDDLKDYRLQFHIPKFNEKESIYFVGNSLGCMPKLAEDYMEQELKDWKNMGVEGHFRAKRPWYSYHEQFMPLLANVVGAKPSEVVPMGSLTNNLHLLMVSFYKPTKTRYKILCEAKSFPSDVYALESQARFHGINPEKAIIEVAPEPGKHMLETNQILQQIEAHKDELALVMMSGVNYYTGQKFDMKTITEKAHSVGAIAGFDLAHAAGNVLLNLHNWDIDFACWCSYKYLNSGPGSVAGVFVHEKHHKKDLQRFHGWWGTNKLNRFKMLRQFESSSTVESWQLSNAPVFAMAPHLASLQIFENVSMQALAEKGERLHAYLRYLINELNKLAGKKIINCLTPENAKDRGCQISLVVEGGGKAVYEYLTKNGVVADWREPDVIRIAPVPLYNTFNECFDFYTLLKEFYGLLTP